VDFGECEIGNENSDIRNENSATSREKLLQLEMDFRNIHHNKIIVIF
jgi:hypothetical protein